MNKYYYDLHIHSCLSPCGDDDMTPNNIAGMGVLNGLNIMALTDHNTSKNCPAFFKAAKKNGIIPIAGMELTTAEDIHVVCLFESLGEAMVFDEFVSTHLMQIPNRTDIFGNQYIMNENDEVTGELPFLLSNATDIMIDEVCETVARFNGVCYPAHVDRDANGIISILGTFPEYEYMEFKLAEFHSGENINDYDEKYPELQNTKKVVSSDAHFLWDIKEKAEYFEIEDEPYSSTLVTKKLFEFLRGEC